MNLKKEGVMSSYVRKAPSFLMLVVVLLLSGCYSSRVFHYRFTRANLIVLRHVFETGQATCANCWGNGACVNIIDTIATSDCYEIQGKCMLRTYNLIAEREDDGASIKVKVGIGTMAHMGPEKQHQSDWLDEIASALDEANAQHSRDGITK